MTTPPHPKYVATLPGNISLIAGHKFSQVVQGVVGILVTLLQIY